MQCRHCDAMAAETDKTCLRCGKRLAGSKARKYAYWTGMVFFGGMYLLLTCVVQSPYPGSTKFNELVASSMATGLLSAGAGMVGMVVGGIVGAFVSD